MFSSKYQWGKVANFQKYKSESFIFKTLSLQKFPAVRYLFNYINQI